MGCWNKTCGLTNLHITHGTEAYVFVLEPSTEDSHCYATHLYKPLLLPFVTEYNDYGGGENSSGVGLPYIMAGIKHNLQELDVGDNKSHDIAVKKADFDEDLFFEAVHEGRLFRRGHYSDPVKLEYVMFRKDSVDHILENRVISRYVGTGKGTYCPYGTGDNSYIQYKFADIVADILPMLLEILEMKANSTDPDNLQFKLLGGFEYLFDYDYPNLAAKWLRGDSYRFCRVVDIKDAIAQALIGDSEEAVLNLEALLTEYLKGVFINNFMEMTRKSWIPAGHEGSQNQDHDDYRLLIAATTMVLDEEDKRWADENSEEEENEVV